MTTMKTGNEGSKGTRLELMVRTTLEARLPQGTAHHELEPWLKLGKAGAP